MLSSNDTCLSSCAEKLHSTFLVKLLPTSSQGPFGYFSKWPLLNHGPTDIFEKNPKGPGDEVGFLPAIRLGDGTETNRTQAPKQQTAGNYRRRTGSDTTAIRQFRDQC